MSLSNYLEPILLDHIRTTYSIYVKLHVGDPGENGTSNASGETDRHAVTFAAASGNTMTSTSTAPEWTNWKTAHAGETITHFSLWTASTAGNCLGYGATNSPRTMAAGDHYKITTLTWSLD